VIVDVQGGEQQRVEIAEPCPDLGVGRRGVRVAGLDVQPAAFALPVDVGGGLLRGRYGQVGIAPDQVALLRRGGVGPLLGRRLGGVHPLHVPNDAHARPLPHSRRSDATISILYGSSDGARPS
jgi:hypothetical protein